MLPTPLAKDRRPNSRHAGCWPALLVALLPLAAGCEGSTAQSHNADGVRLYQQARYSDALREFQEANYVDPQNADGYYNLAATYHRVGVAENRAAELRQAEECYHECLNRDPNHRDCYRGLAVLLTQQGRGEEAMRLLQTWADRQPHAADPKVELARLNEELGRTNEAKDRLTEAVAAEPYNARAWAALGRLRESHGDPAQALVDYQQSLACDQYQPDVAARAAALAPTVSPPGTVPAANPALAGSPAAGSPGVSPLLASPGPGPVRTVNVTPVGAVR